MVSRTVINGVLNGQYNYCCLCLKEVENPAIRVQDEIAIYGIQKPVEMFDILGHVLGSDVLDMISSYDAVCNHCQKQAVHSWSFIKISKENIKCLDNVIGSLTKCFHTTDKSTINVSKSLLVKFNTTDLSHQTYYDSKQLMKCNLTLLKRFNLITSRKPKKRKEEVDLDYDDFYVPLVEECDTVQNTVLKKDCKPKKSTNSTLIPTKNMMYDKNDFRCKKCLKVYTTGQTLRQHYIRVHAPKQFKCSKCSRCYGSEYLLCQHQQDSHSPAVCVQCGKAYANRHSLKIHELGHKTKIICQACGRSYKHKKTFRSHIQSNVCQQKEKKSNSEAKFTCDYCQKKFGHKPTLRVHIQFEHGNSKAYICNWCKKRFNAQSKLNAHIVTHTQEKKFTCDICGGKYVTKESLLYHTRIHTGEKPYKCHQCDKSFLSASRRAVHTRRSHMEPCLECEICNNKFKERSCLLRHRKRHFDPKSKLHSSIKPSETNV